MKTARYCEIRRIPVTTHGVPNIHVHLLAGLPNASYMEVSLSFPSVATSFGVYLYCERAIAIQEEEGGMGYLLGRRGKEMRVQRVDTRRDIKDTERATNCATKVFITSRSRTVLCRYRISESTLSSTSRYR